LDKICVIVKILITNIEKYSIEKILDAEVKIKTHKLSPNVTVNALNFG